MLLEEGKLYNVSGRQIHGAGSTAERDTEFWRDVMCIAYEPIKSKCVPGFLADGNQYGGLFDKNILTKIKTQKGKFRLVGKNVITNNILYKTMISLPAGEHSEGLDRSLRRAEFFADKLPDGEKRERYLAMIRDSLYEERIEGRVEIIIIKDPVIRGLMQRIID